MQSNSSNQNYLVSSIVHILTLQQQQQIIAMVPTQIYNQKHLLLRRKGAYQEIQVTFLTAIDLS